MTTTEISSMLPSSPISKCIFFSFLSNRREERETSGWYYTRTLTRSCDLAMALAVWLGESPRTLLYLAVDPVLLIHFTYNFGTNIFVAGLLSLVLSVSSVEN